MIQKKYAYIIESRNVEAGLDKAKDILKSVYSKEGVKKRASKVEALKLNERGVEAVYKQINGNNLVVTELGDLNIDLLGELNSSGSILLNFPSCKELSININTESPA